MDGLPATAVDRELLARQLDRPGACTSIQILTVVVEDVERTAGVVTQELAWQRGVVARRIVLGGARSEW